MFVARQGLLNDLTGWVKRAAETKSRHHTLIVGQRGAGKTHLLALLYHRASDLIHDGSRLQLARLPEDPLTIISYGRLLGAILKTLGAGNPVGLEDELEHRINQLFKSHGVIVVFAENMDEIFTQIGIDGQRRLRSFLQSSPALLLMATTTTLDRSMTDQASPFYDYFSTLKLAPLTPDQAKELIAKIAATRHDELLSAQLALPIAQNRLTAIQRLTGGQPRLLVTFGQIIRPDDIHKMGDVLHETLDDLTPYYQDRLRQLSAQQRLIVDALANADHCMSNQDLAAQLQLQQTSVARSIGELKELGWVVSVVTPWKDLLDGRRSFYELAEPLAAMAFQIKDSVDESLGVVIDFLVWLAAEVTRQMDTTFGNDQSVGVARRLTGLPDRNALELFGEVDDAISALSSGDAKPIMALPTLVRSALAEQWDTAACANSTSSPTVGLRCEIHEVALAEMGSVPHEPQTSQWIARAENLAESAQPAAMSLWSRWSLHARRFDEANSIAALAIPTSA